jgi:hypothetical protein
VLDVAPYKRVQPRLGLTREGARQEHDRAERARLGVNRVARLARLAPQLSGQESNQQPEYQAHGRQHPGRDGLERARPIPLGKGHHGEVDAGGYEEGGREHRNHEPDERKIVHPADHAR